MSSVFLDGSAGDIRLGNTATEVDWPAATQAETYFAASPDANPSSNPKRWLGTFVANGQGTTGMLYRRNRYFDPKSGQFTQADPIGIAGGMNVFGFANGDPVNFNDPFGLLPCWLVNPDLCRSNIFTKVAKAFAIATVKGFSSAWDDTPPPVGGGEAEPGIGIGLRKRL